LPHIQGTAAERLVIEVAEMQKPLASSSGLELQVDLRHDVPDVGGDHGRLLQVFENLIGNAIKFTKVGGPITVGATPRDREALFWVADTGCGIAPENCLMSSTDFGKLQGLTVKAQASVFPSPRALSKLTADTLGSRARRVGEVLCSSRFQPVYRRKSRRPVENRLCLFDRLRESRMRGQR
jgi:hypothetical protein